MKMNPEVSPYFIDGCGRCPKGKTPDCKVNFWQKELKELRNILLESGLKEELKWSVPCYTYQGKNVVILGAFIKCCTLNFVKGTLISDPFGLLVKPGENSRSGRQMRFENTDQISKHLPSIRAFLQESIQIEKEGRKVKVENESEPFPDELKDLFSENDELKKAFSQLTPGRQRGYIIYFTGAKKTETRLSRIEKYKDQILAGKGIYD